MRWTDWILTAAMVAVCVGQANGQSGCRGCGGGTAAWQSNSMYLAGEACLSPPGYAGGIAMSGCYCGPSQPCCDNAWAGYCCHHAKVQAFLTRIGVPKVRCYPGSPKAVMPAAGCVECPDPTEQPTPTVAPIRPLPPVPPVPATKTSRTLSPEPQAPSEDALRMPQQRWSSRS
jgi:hypothetical protein